MTIPGPIACPLACGWTAYAITHTQARALTTKHQRTCKEKK